MSKNERIISISESFMTKFHELPKQPTYIHCTFSSHTATYAFQNMIILSEAKFFMLNTYFCDKNGLLPFNFGYAAKIENLTLTSFFQPIFIDKIFSRISYQKCARNMNISFQSKIMIIKNSQITRRTTFTGNKLGGDLGEISNLSLFQVREKFECIEHIGKGENQL